MKLSRITTYVLAVTYLSGCQTSDTSSSTSGVSDLGSLPKATSPVRSSSAALLSGNLFKASTGVKLKNAHSNTWSATKSRPMCEVSRIVRDTYLHAATPDAMVCAVSAMSNNNVFGTSIYDGNGKYYKFGGDIGETKIKFTAAKSGGAITTFNMFICQSSSGTYTQNGYVGQDLTNVSAISAGSVFKATISGDVYGARSALTGAIGTDGVWSEKVLTSITTSTKSSKTFTSKSTVTQYSDRVKLDAFMKGEASTDTFTNRLFGVAQILSADSLATFALGDGSARYILSMVRSGGNTQSFDNTKSWTGDDQLPVASPSSNGSYYSTVDGQTPRAAETVAVTFDEAETWDCSAPTGSSFSEVTFLNVSLKLVTDIAACVSTYAGAYRDYVDCYTAAGQ